MSFSAKSLLGLTVAGRYELLEYLGAGGYGTVFRAIDLDAEDGPSHYAIKALKEPEVGSVEELLLEREVRYHERVTGHENVVSFYDVFNEDGWVFLLLELSEAGTLHELIADNDLYDSDDRDARIKTIFLDVLMAVEHCHRQHVFHRDLKPENILCASDGTQIRIADFGLATDENVSMQKMCGTKGYLPPESMKDTPAPVLPSSQDIWALGILLIALIARRAPWSIANNTDLCWRAYLRSPAPEKSLLSAFDLSPEVVTLLGDILQQSPFERLQLYQLRDRVLDINHFFKPKQSLKKLSPPVPRQTLAPPPRHHPRRVTAALQSDPRRTLPPSPPRHPLQGVGVALQPASLGPSPLTAASSRPVVTTCKLLTASPYPSSLVTSSSESTGPITPYWPPEVVIDIVSELEVEAHGEAGMQSLPMESPVPKAQHLSISLPTPLLDSAVFDIKSSVEVDIAQVSKSVVSAFSQIQPRPIEILSMASPVPKAILYPISLPAPSHDSDIGSLVEVDIAGLSKPVIPATVLIQPQPIQPMMIVAASPSIHECPKTAKITLALLLSWLPLCV